MSTVSRMGGVTLLNAVCSGTIGRLGVDSFKDWRGRVAKRTMFWNILAAGCRQFQGLEGSCFQVHYLLEHSGGWVLTVSRFGGVAMLNAVCSGTYEGNIHWEEPVMIARIPIQLPIMVQPPRGLHHVLEHSGGWVSTVSRMGGVTVLNAP